MDREYVTGLQEKYERFPLRYNDFSLYIIYSYISFQFLCILFSEWMVMSGSVVLHLLMAFNVFDPFHLFYFTLFFL